MSEKIHLPEDIGDTPAKAGAKLITESYPFVLAEDALVQYAGVFPPNSPAELLNPIYKPASENTTDAFSLNRKVRSSILFRNVSNYDIEPNQWGIQLSDTTDGGTSESIIWTERINARASYPGSLAEVKFLPQVSAIQLRNYPVSSNIGYQQTVLFSNRVFSAGTNPILVTVAVSMTLSDNPNCSKTWGLFGGNSGYFFRIYGTGQADNFKVGYRRTLGGSTNEVEIPRGQFNGDKLDGTKGHTQTFTNVGMFGVEVGTAGIGARFWAYVEIGGSARWVLVHSLQNDSDGSQDRITDEEGLPISFEVKNIGQSTTLQTLSKYGTSVTSLGDPVSSNDSRSIGNSKSISEYVKPFPILGIRSADFINGKKNFNTILATNISLMAKQGLWKILLILNPTKNNSLAWTSTDNLSGLQFNKDNYFVRGGRVISHYFISGNKPVIIRLKDLFSLNKTSMTSQYTNDAPTVGDYGQQFLISSDELWVCAVSANVASSNNTDLIWNPGKLVFCSPTYESASSYNLVESEIFANITTQEVN